MKIRWLSFSAVFVLLFTGCGYAFRGSGSVLPPDVKKIIIPMVENNSTEPGLSAVVTEALRDQFERYGVVTVVEGYGDADAVLKARIKGVSRQTKTVTSKTDTDLQLDTTLTMAAELRRVTGTVIWRNPDVAVSKSFGSAKNAVVTTSADFATGSLNAGDLAQLDTREISRGQEGEALRYLAEQISKSIYDQAVSPDF